MSSIIPSNDVRNALMWSATPIDEVAPFIIESAIDDTKIMVSIQAAAALQRSRVNICFVLDISGSMAANVTAGNGESNGLDRLDIAKHAIKSVICTLGDDDMCSLVIYGSMAAQIFTKLRMDKNGKDAAYAKIDPISTNGCTNMWAGMDLAFMLLKESAPYFFNQHMFVLTDGSSPDAPPGGQTFPAAMKMVKEASGGKYPCTVHTFGFAYDLDSSLMLQIAQEGNGMFAFIPDGSMVGTVFINALANSYITVGHNATLSCEHPSSTVNITRVDGSDNIKMESWGVKIDLNSLQESRRLDYVFYLNSPIVDPRDVIFKFSFISSLTGQTVSTTVAANVAFSDGAASVIRSRDLTIRSINNGLNRASSVAVLDSITDITQWKADHPELPEHLRGHITGLISDLNGQVREALSKPESFQRWGCHYLRSLGRAHELQQCNNFKDPGLQFYATELFENIRGEAEDNFMKLPAPVVRVYQNYGSYGGGGGGPSASAPPAAPVNMASYMDQRGGCIFGECLATLSDGSTKKICQLLKGDKLSSGVVRCVVRSRLSAQNMELVQIDNLIITAWHPIQPISSNNNAAWVFPKNHSDAKIWQTRNFDNQMDSNNFVYSFLLDDNALGMAVEGFNCATLAHGQSDSTGVLAHSFFGTQDVLLALQKCRGFSLGLVDAEFVRDANFGVISGLVEV